MHALNIINNEFNLIECILNDSAGMVYLQLGDLCYVRT